MAQSLPKTKAPQITEWRDWLAANHKESKGVWLHLAKKDSGIPSITVEDAIEEALCWGWIDSLPNKIDDQWFKLRFSPRNPKSNWSARNKTIVEQMIQQGRMQPAGLAMIDLAKQSGTWSALDKVEALICPPEMEALWQTHPKAFAYWEEFPRSVKRGILEWIYAAKRQETKENRIKTTVSMATNNERANQYTNVKPKS